MQTEKIPVPMKVKLPGDLVGKIREDQITKIQAVEMLRIPVWSDVKIGFWERTGFYVKKVLPFALEILKFYFPVSIPILNHFYQNREVSVMQEKSLLESIKGYLANFLSRWLLKIGGGFLLAHGVNEGSVEEIAGAVVSILLGIVISLVNQKTAINTDPKKPS